MSIALRQRHPCQRRLAVLCVIHRCFRGSGIEGRKRCIDVARYEDFEGRFIADGRWFVADNAGQYDGRRYPGNRDPTDNSDPGAGGARLPGTRRLRTWRPVLPAGQFRGNLMLCFWLTHVPDIHFWDRKIMIDGRCDDNPEFTESKSKPTLNDIEFHS
jgi:hypothetical protein